MAHRGRGPSSFPSAPSDDMGSSSMSFEVVAIGTKNRRLFFFFAGRAPFSMTRARALGFPFSFDVFFLWIFILCCAGQRTSFRAQQIRGMSTSRWKTAFWNSKNSSARSAGRQKLSRWPTQSTERKAKKLHSVFFSLSLSLSLSFHLFFLSLSSIRGQDRRPIPVRSAAPLLFAVHNTKLGKNAGQTRQTLVE